MMVTCVLQHPTMVTVSFREVDTSSRCFSVTVADVDCGLTVIINRLTHCFTAPGRLTFALHTVFSPAAIYSVTLLL